MVDVRLLQHVEELAGIGRQRLDIAPLALGIDGVEGERLDLPEPDSPVITTSFSRGRSSEIFLRLCSRAPRMEMNLEVILSAMSAWAAG